MNSTNHGSKIKILSDVSGLGPAFELMLQEDLHLLP